LRWRVPWETKLQVNTERKNLLILLQIVNMENCVRETVNHARIRNDDR